MRGIGSLAVLAAVPLGSLSVLWAAGQLGVVPAGIAAAVCLLAAGLIAGLWRRDIDRVALMLTRPHAPARPVLRSLAALAGGIDRQTRGLVARAAEIDAARRASDAIIEHLPDPLLLLDAGGNLVRRNAAAGAAFGADLAAVLRHPVLRGAIERALAGGGAVTADLALPVPVPREVQASVIALSPRGAETTAVLVVLSDRTRERAVERMRSDFVTNASHELRTPLASLIGFIDTLRGPAADDPPAQRRFLGIMAEQGARMHRLIDDLLSLSRIELSEHLPPGERVDLAVLARSVAAGFEPRLAGGKLRLAIDLAAGLPPVAGDADQLAQVLNNLIDNAVKYGGEAGTVRLAVERPAGPRWPVVPGVLVTVSDEGPGIPRAQLPRLTERFYRVDKARSRGVGGTGLGLAIVKHIVNRHRGQLAIDSEEGKGSTFSIWLPVAGG